MVLTLVCFEDIFARLSLALLFVTDQPLNLGGVIPRDFIWVFGDTSSALRAVLFDCQWEWLSPVLHRARDHWF